MKDTIFQNVMAQIKAGKGTARLYPKSTEREVWMQIADSQPGIRKFCIDQAEEFLKTPIPLARLSDALRYQQDGDRGSYETPYFRRRGRLGTIAFAYLFSKDEARRTVYFKEIIDTVGVILEEEYWAVPAHRHYEEDDPYAPSDTRWLVDLFDATTGALMALIYHIFEDEFAAVSPRLVRRIRDKVYDRLLLPVIDEKVHLWWLRHHYNNWTIWICNNLLTSALCILDRTSADFETLLEKSLLGMERFCGTYEDDGYCDEGVSYWARAGAELMAFVNRLETVFPDSAGVLIKQKKFLAMARFPLEMHMSKAHYSTFSDGHPHTSIHPAPLCIAEELTGDRTLSSGAAPRSEWYNVGTGEGFRIILELLFSKVKAGRNCTGLKRDSIYENRLAILRNRTFCASLKGGDNAENHNHNDLGHFSLYCGEMPVVLDLGAGKYCRQYFGKERYDLVPAAKYHNAALIDGKGQEFGKHFTAPIAYDARKKTATVSLENAYPESFGIREMNRTIRLKGDSFTVTDTLKRDGNGERVTVVFYSPAVSVKQLKSGALVFDKTVTMTLSGATVSSLIREQFPDAVVTRNWGEKLWRIELTVDADASCWEMCFQR